MHDKARLELMKSPTICQDSDTVQVTFLHSKQALERIPQTFSFEYKGRREQKATQFHLMCLQREYTVIKLFDEIFLSAIDSLCFIAIFINRLGFPDSALLEPKASLTCDFNLCKFSCRTSSSRCTGSGSNGSSGFF